MPMYPRRSWKPRFLAEGSAIDNFVVLISETGLGPFLDATDHIIERVAINIECSDRELNARTLSDVQRFLGPQEPILIDGLNRDAHRQKSPHLGLTRPGDVI